MIVENNAFDDLRMARKVRLNPDEDHLAWYSSAEDIILKKLAFCQMGGSDKHLRDIAGVPLIQGELIDQTYLTDWAVKPGVAEELQLVRDRLREAGQ